MAVFVGVVAHRSQKLAAQTLASIFRKYSQGVDVKFACLGFFFYLGFKSGVFFHHFEGTGFQLREFASVVAADGSCRKAVHFSYKSILEAIL